MTSSSLHVVETIHSIIQIINNISIDVIIVALRLCVQMVAVGRK